MPRHRWDPVADRPRGLVRPVRAGSPGGPTRSQVSDRRHWRTTSRGWHVPTYVNDGLPEQRILEQSVRLPERGAVTGWAACRLLGAAFFDGLARDGETPKPVPLALGSSGRIRADEQVVLLYHRLPEEERLVRHGIPTVVPARAVVDHVRLQVDVREAVVAIDMMAAAELLARKQLAAYAASLRPRDRKLLEWAIGLASEHSRSPNETRLRLVAELDAGLPRLLVNCPVHDLAGRLLGIADLLDLVAGLAIEYDGADHRTAVRHARDVAKEAAFHRVGLEVARVTGGDLPNTQAVVERVHEARSRAVFAKPERRRWVAKPPLDRLHQLLVEREEARARHEELVAAVRSTPRRS